MKRLRRIGQIIGLLLISEWASAGSLLDYLRSYDLNDYSLGLGFSASQNPYAGAKDSGYLYPYLTSFEHSSMTDGWLLIRDGELGFRWVTDNGWELGAIGRVQTRGLGNLETNELLGISDRKWALELGPTISWRGWPVHVSWTTYVEPTNRHDGVTSQLALTWPKQFSRGYFVPSIDVRHQSDNYADYYYSVTTAEATPSRPSYQARANISIGATLRMGYALSDKWLITGNVGFEKFGSEITDSPIVDRDRVWSGGVALAYNADVFQPREYDGTRSAPPKFSLQIGAFRSTLGTTISRDTADGVPGFDIDIEDLLGVSDEETVLQLDAIWRIGHYHRLEFGYFELGRNASVTLGRDISFGDEFFPAGTELDTQIDLSVFRAGYAYSLIRNEQLEFSVMAGLHIIKLETDISDSLSGERGRSIVGTPLPVVGLGASVFISERTAVNAQLQVFRTDFDRFEGSLNYAALDIQHRFGDSFSVGLGYNFYRMKLSSDDSDVNGRLKLDHRGPVVFFTLGY